MKKSFLIIMCITLVVILLAYAASSAGILEIEHLVANLVWVINYPRYKLR